MESLGKAKRIRIYVKESDVIGHKPAPYALLDWLRQQGAAGATLIRAAAGVGASGQLDVELVADLGPHLPVIVEWIDSPDRVARLLPALKDLVGRGLITSEDTEIVLYKAHGVRRLPEAVTAAQVMSRDVASVPPEAPLRQVVELIEGRAYRAVPVVTGGRPVGMITNLDLVERGGLLARVELLGSLTETERTSALGALGSKTARDVMTPDPVTVPETATLGAVADAMARKRLKRLPVVDARGALVGMVSRFDLLRTVAEAFKASPDEARPAGLRGELPLSRVMRKDVPAVHPDTPIAEVLQAVVSTRLNRALVVDAERRVLGIVTDEEVLDRVAPGLRTSALTSLMHRLPFSHVARADLAAEHHSRAKTAKDLMLTEVAVARQDQPLREAIAPMMKAPHKLVAVVDPEGRLVGALDRADILRGLVQD
jgi:CBS domain-containing protein/PII-like signaling protein